MMTTVLRAVAIMIAVVALFDPAVALRRRAPLGVEIVLPAASDPTYAEAQTLARELERDLAGMAGPAGADPANARIVLGNADVPADIGVPVYVVAGGTRGPRAILSQVRSDGEVVAGQTAGVEVEVRGEGLVGRLSTISLLDRGFAVAAVEHTWTAENAPFVARLPYAPSGPGVHPLTVDVRTTGIESAATADTAVVAVERPLRVLIYEPRPSWAAAFVRRALEDDPVFAVTGLSRSGRGIATRLGSAPRSIEVLDANALDVVVVGAPDALTSDELLSLDRFTSTRGGGLLLVPDRRLTPAVEHQFGLPATEELLLEKAVAAASGPVTVHASELLLPRQPERGAFTPLARARVGSADRTAILAVYRGEGTVILSGLLDAWRHRSQEPPADAFWRALVAELAVAAPQRLQLRLEPAVARPGDRVKVSATWRRDAITAAGAILVPGTSASIARGTGWQDELRLWPGGRTGELEGWLTAPAEGLYSVTATSEVATAHAILRVDEDIVHARESTARAAEFAAATSGGAVVRSTAELITRLRALDVPVVEARVRLMRSPLWMLPFAGCLCVDWVIRRRRGQR